MIICFALDEDRSRSDLVLTLSLPSRLLFKDQDRNWEDIERKLKSESDAPLLKSSGNVLERLGHFTSIAVGLGRG